MHVECSSCNTRYTIADEKIPAQGARVRCRKCQAVFLVERPSAPEPSPLPLIPPTPEAPSPAPAPPAHASAPQAPPAMRPAPAAPAPSMTPPAPPSAPAGNPFMPSSAHPESVAPPEIERFTPAFAAGAQAVADAEPVTQPAAPMPPPRPAPPPPIQAASAPAPAPAAPPAAPATAPPRPASPYSPSAGIPEGLPEAERLKHERARRFARVLASDIAIYNKEKRDRGVADGNLVAVLGYEIKKSWEVYKERVTPELANSTPYFRDALNEMLAEGKKVF
jgi:predicted Zn finger-like uncharacterized protein